MQEHNLFRLFTDRLNEAGIPYAVTGSVASIVYGEPRLTHDIDLVLLLSIEKAPALRNMFSDREFYFPPDEVLINEIKRKTRGHCNIIHLESGFKADIYLVGQDGFLKWAVDNAKKIEFEDSAISIAPPEYVIVKKLEYFKEGGSEKHLLDIKAILNNSRDQIDFNMLSNLISTWGLQETWEKVETS